MSTDWIKKWQEGDIRFHQHKFHPQLEAFGERFSEGTVLVPLCGKTLDMLYLASRGHEVVGVELSSLACRSFFEEHGIPFTVKSIEGFEVYGSEQITIWCGDFFKLPQNVWDKVSGVYDRASLIALESELRQKYAAEIFNRSTKPIEILLISIEYAEGSLAGPPFSVPESEITNLYKKFKLQKLHSSKDAVREFEVIESTYWLLKN
ncbi:MAG: thiopurine S-methyltransferase [Bdellovibrionales bacterium]|nr:thiopurine S-methyltransferase [Bdellovibrionales bacterium]